MYVRLFSRVHVPLIIEQMLYCMSGPVSLSLCVGYYTAYRVNVGGRIWRGRGRGSVHIIVRRLVSIMHIFGY